MWLKRLCVFIGLTCFVLTLPLFTVHRYLVKEAYLKGRLFGANGNMHQLQRLSPIFDGSRHKLQSILFTNHLRDGQGPHDKPVDLLARTKIFDVSFVCYSAEFAERYGYPEKFVYPLQDGLQAVEIKMITRGVYINIALNILMVPRSDLDLPKESIFRVQNEIKFPPRKKEMGFDKEYIEFRKKETWSEDLYFPKNIMLTDYNYDVQTSPNWRAMGIIEYSKRLRKNLDFLSISLTEAIVLNLARREMPSLWIRKKMSWPGYSNRKQLAPNEFVKFRLPKELIQKMVPVVDQGEFFNHATVLQTYHKELANGR